MLAEGANIEPGRPRHDPLGLAGRSLRPARRGRPRRRRATSARWSARPWASGSTPPPVFERMIADRRLGRKGKRGFYLYEEKEGKEQGAEKQVDPAVYALLGWQAKPDLRPGDRRALLAPDAQRDRPLHGGRDHHQPRRRRHRRHLRLRLPPFRGGLLREADRHGLALGGRDAGRLRRPLRRAPAARRAPARDGEKGETFYKS